MQHLLTNLSNTISKGLIIDLIKDELEIKEDGSPCKKVILKSKRKQIFAFSLDTNLANRCKMFPFFNQSTQLINKVNDGIVFYLNDGKIFVLLIELKSNKLGDYKKQLQAGKNFVYLLLSTLNNSFSSNYTVEEENIKCLVFSLRKTIKKQGTKRANIIYEKIDGLNIKELQCNDTHFLEKFL
jgi:hypothetical protein